MIERAAKLQMRRFIREIDFHRVPCETAIGIGRPAYEICQAAEDTGADLIITSTHGLTGFAHVLVGSVAEHVVRHAHCSVMVVPTRDCEGAEDRRQS